MLPGFDKMLNAGCDGRDACGWTQRVLETGPLPVGPGTVANVAFMLGAPVARHQARHPTFFHHHFARSAL